MLRTEDERMQLGETIATYDVALALRGESGKFEVTSPAGEIYHVTCKPNLSITNLECSENKSEAQPFLIRKVAEPVSMEPGKTMLSGAFESASQPKPARTPFLIENQEAVLKPSSSDPAQQPNDPKDEVRIMEACNLELFYGENDPDTGQPSAFVYSQNGQSDNNSRPARPMTVVCTNFNELDVEIRKLHADLDQIRSRARKKFYKAQAAAASA
jgi:hypothetical protein